MKTKILDSSPASIVEEKPTRLIPVTKWHEFHSWPPIGGLRHIIFFSETNGFRESIVRVGRRVLIDEHSFFMCARKNGQGK